MYHARPEFDEFQMLSELIAELQSELPEDQYSSKRIQRVYTVYVGDLTNVLDTHWSTVVNEKTHSFWSHRQLVDRLELTLGDVGITVEQVSEAESSSECPECGSDEVSREGDSFRCHACELDAHSDVAGAWNLLQSEVGPMARPAALSAERDRDAPVDGAYWEWNGHDWTPASFGEQSSPVDQTSVGKPVSSQPG